MAKKEPERKELEKTRDTEDRTERESRRYPSRWGDTPLRDVFDRFIDDRPWLEPFPRMLGRFDRAFFPRVDVSETPREIKVVADIPGVDPDNLEIDVHDNRLRISGKTEKEYESKDNERPYRYERTYGSFQREFTLPARVSEESVRAACKDGVLTITMQKAEEEKKRKIAIERQ